MNTEKMTGARFIAETFKGYGVTHVFFVPAILRRTLVELESIGIKRILAHSEKAAAYMADGYARVTRKPGICMAQSVGAANLAAGLQDAFLGLSPVIALTGRKPPTAQYRHAYQEVFHYPFFDPVTKYNVNVDTVEQLPLLMRQAFREATSGAPGPVHLDVVGHVGDILETSEADLEVMIEPAFDHYPPSRPIPDGKAVEAAARLLCEAKRPVIVAGGGATASSAGPGIVRLAEMMSIPVATALNGKGVIPENHPFSVGVVGSYSRWCANRVVSEADLVLFIGSRAGDQVTNGWAVPKPGTPVIQIDIDPAELGRSYLNAVSLMGDAGTAVQEIIKSIPSEQKRKPWMATVKERITTWREEMTPLYESGAVPIRPERLCKAITDMLPSDAVLVSDTGYSGIWTGALVELHHSNQQYLRAAGSLGWAFPAALGAKCSVPDRPVVCFTGDGGFWYHLSELETAVRCGIHTMTIVNNNSSLSQCLGGVDWAYENRPGNREEIYCFNEVNFAELAELMGALGIRVDDPGNIDDALRTALSAGKPSVVEVLTDPAVRAPAPWAPE